MQTLRVYLSTSCLMYERTMRLVAAVRAGRPAYPVELVDLDAPGSVRPPYVFGTPTFVLGDRIVSLGNPAPQELLALLDAAAHT